MENIFLDGLKKETNYTYTTNGALMHKSTLNSVFDMFSFGGSMRESSEEEIKKLFLNAFEDDPKYALKCLFYLRDREDGAGERRFFRVAMKTLARTNPEAAMRVMDKIPEFGRWDDLYVFEGTNLEDKMFSIMKDQLALDVVAEYPSLLAKWLKSTNCSSAESCRLGNKTRIAFGMTHRQYRKTLSTLRKRINVLERLMSANEWDKIEFDKIPSRAGLIYREAFKRHDVEREKTEGVKTYKEFMADTSTKVNAKMLYPQEIVREIFKHPYWKIPDATDRQLWQKAWDGLKDFYMGREENGLGVVDVSGSMEGTPMEAAIGLGAYVATKTKGPFANHFITFSSKPDLVRFQGEDIYEKVHNAKNADWQMNTNIEAVFDLLLNTAVKNGYSQSDMPAKLYIFSDMQFDSCVRVGYSEGVNHWYRRPEYGTQITENQMDTFMETMRKRWAAKGYNLPSLIFWNLNAKNQVIPAIGPGFSCVSGFSASMVDTILSGKDGIDLMLAKLDSDRYKDIY